MVGSDGEQDLVRRQVEQAVDPDGSMTAFLGLIGRVPRLPEWLDRLSKGFLGEMKDLSVEHERLLASTAEALEVLGARGWAVLNMNAEAVERACDLVRQGQDAEADELLADEWDEQWRLRRIANRVRAMGAGDEDYQAFFRARGRLLDKATPRRRPDTGRSRPGTRSAPARSATERRRLCPPRWASGRAPRTPGRS